MENNIVNLVVLLTVGAIVFGVLIVDHNLNKKKNAENK